MFLVTKIDITWDFGSTDRTARHVQDPWESTSCTPAATLTRARAEYTKDRREGSVQMSFDARGYFRLEWNDTNARFRRVKYSISRPEADDDSVRETQREALACDEDNVQKMSNPRLGYLKMIKFHGKGCKEIVKKNNRNSAGA